MKNKFYTYFIAVIAVAYIIINLLVFTLVDFARLNNPQFWVSWGFMFGVNIVMTVLVGLKVRKTDKHDIRVFPITLIAGGNIIYLALGIVFTLFLPKIVYVIVADIIVSLVYALLCYRFVLAISYVRANDAHRREKISYIRNVTAMVESYVALAPDTDTADVIKKLASDFRYSDPMSSEKLADEERKIMDLAIRFEDVVRAGNAEEINKAAEEIKRELKYRNTMCANYK